MHTLAILMGMINLILTLALILMRRQSEDQPLCISLITHILGS